MSHQQICSNLNAEVVMIFKILPIYVSILVFRLLKGMCNGALCDVQSMAHKGRYKISIGIVTNDKIWLAPQLSKNFLCGINCKLLQIRPNLES